MAWNTSTSDIIKGGLREYKIKIKHLLLRSPLYTIYKGISKRVNQYPGYSFEAVTIKIYKG